MIIKTKAVVALNELNLITFLDGPEVVCEWVNTHQSLIRQILTTLSSIDAERLVEAIATYEKGIHARHIDRMNAITTMKEAAAPPVTGGAWLPIESAPKDESTFVCRHKAKPHVTFEAAIFEEDDGWEYGSKTYHVIHNMTADEPLDADWCDLEWQPLPAPPSSAEQTRGEE